MNLRKRKNFAMEIDGFFFSRHFFDRSSKKKKNNYVSFFV